MPASPCRRFFSVRSILLLAISAGFVFSLVSCHNNMIYRENKHINATGWSPADSIYFRFQITDTVTPLDFYFNVRNTTDYTYQNLYFFITTVYPDGAYSRDTAECILAGIDGKWLGKGMWKTRDSKFLFKKQLRLRKAGEYTLIVNQAMREELLRGIADIGLIIEQPKEN